LKVGNARGEAMQAASDTIDLTLEWFLLLDLIRRLLVSSAQLPASEKSGEKMQIANFLCAGNYVISGWSSKACDAVCEIAKPEVKARRPVKLAVAGAFFHTDFMAPAGAVSALQHVLETIEIKTPRIPGISNVDAVPHSNPDTIKKLLATQARLLSGAPMLRYTRSL